MSGVAPVAAARGSTARRAVRPALHSHLRNRVGSAHDHRPQDLRDFSRRRPGRTRRHLCDLALASHRVAALLALAGTAALFGYAAVQTLQPEDRYGRLYAAYAGVFLIGAVLWGWGIDGKEPDRFDWIGASIVLLGALVILWGRRIFA